MLTGLHVGNFKAFAATQHIPLKPLTLIFGANSSGKSSIIHSLLFGHEASTSDEVNRLDVKRPRIGGESVDLGGFRQFVHRRNPGHQVEWGVDLNVRDLDQRLRDLFGDSASVSVFVTIGIEQRQGTARARISASGEEIDVPGEVEQAGAPRVESYRIETGERALLRASAKGSPDRRRMGLDQLDIQHSVVRRAIEAMVLMGTTTGAIQDDDQAAIHDAIDSLVPELSLRGERLFPSGVEWPKPDDGGMQAQLFPIGKGTRREDLISAVRFYLPRVLNDLVGGIEAALQATFRSTRYLGPLRSYPARHLVFSQDHDTNWQAGGGWAWDRVRTDAAVRKRVNEWLGSPKWMKTPYRLTVNRLYSEPDVAEAFWTSLERLAEDGLSIEPDYDRSEVPEGAHATIQNMQREADRFSDLLEAQASEAIQDLVLVDVQKKTLVSHRDIGIGVSQVLPVLVSAFALRDALVAMEQPELHLHPALQAELGDVFIESALTQGNHLLLETHSEHVILRVMKRMRETAKGVLPHGMRPVRPEDVAVLYVEPDGAGAIVREMPINEDGELVKAWPGGFFEEGLREVF